MNLLKDIWLPVRKKDSLQTEIAPWQILDDYDTNPVMDVEAPRPDFRNAIFQLLIGLIQVSAMPEEEEDWNDYWHEPFPAEEFKSRLLQYEECFEIDSEGPAFMQDYDLDINEQSSLAKLLIYQLMDNQFNRDVPEKIDIYWSAVALYALQTFGPAQGSGYRTGIRGGGPLTTLLYPQTVNFGEPTLWHKLWINILPENYITSLSGNMAKKDTADIFPWMKPTKISDNNQELYTSECHPFHMYFAMPGRIRLVFSDRGGICDLTGKQSAKLVTAIHMKNKGNNYAGSWIHPLNAYSQLKQNEPPIPVKGNPGCITYRNWSTLVLKYQQESSFIARIIQCFYSSYYRNNLLKNSNFCIWAAGYDLTNARVNHWYESALPVFSIPMEIVPEFIKILDAWVQAAESILQQIKKSIKIAWYKNPKEVKNNFPLINDSFWSLTESGFYSQVKRLAESKLDREQVSCCAEDYYSVISRQAVQIFENLAMSSQEDGLDMKRIFKGRRKLLMTLGYEKKKHFANYIQMKQEA